MQTVHKLFRVGYGLIVAGFLGCAGALTIFALGELWRGVNPLVPLPLPARFNAVLECVGLLTIAVAALELGQTVLEEEILRDAHLSAPTRVRRFLSRFMIVVVVSLSIECLVAVFQLVHEAPQRLPQAAMIGLAAAALLAAWGLFVRLNTRAEELEPEAMEQAVDEDRKVERPGA